MAFLVLVLLGHFLLTVTADCPPPSLWAGPFNTTHVRLQWQAEGGRLYSQVQNFAVGYDGGAGDGRVLPATTTEVLLYTGGTLGAGGEVQCTVLASCADGSKAASSTVTTQSMVRDAPPTAPAASLVNVLETELTVQWRVTPRAFTEGITKYTVEKDGVEAKQLNLNLQLQLDAAQRGGVAMQVKLGSLRAGVEYTLSVVAHNWYGRTPSKEFAATTKTKSCGSIDCGLSPTCTGGETLSSTTLAGRCCPIVFCVCDVDNCATAPVTCTADNAVLTAKVDGQCCPTHTCVPWKDTCDVDGRSCTCPAGRAGRKCELDNPDNLPCGAGCGKCDERIESTTLCTACTNSMFLLDGFCQEACPDEGFEAAGAWAVEGRRCQPQLPCPFKSVEGDVAEHPHKSTWCNGPESVCYCDAGEHSCRDHACANGGAIVVAATTTTTTAAAARITTVTTVSRGKDTTTAAATTATPSGVATTTRSIGGGGAEGGDATADPAGAQVDGGWSKWSGYRECAAPATTATACYEERVRTCSEPWPQNNGLPCDGKDKQSRSCRCPGQGHGEDSTTGPLTSLPPAPSVTQTAVEASTTHAARTTAGPTTGGSNGSSSSASNDLPSNTSADGADLGNSNANGNVIANQQLNSAGSDGSGAATTQVGGKKSSNAGVTAAVVIPLLLLLAAGLVAFRIYKKRRQDAYNINAYFVGREAPPPRRSVSGDYTPKFNSDALSPAARVLEDKQSMEMLQQQSTVAAEEAAASQAAAKQAAERRAAAAQKLPPTPARRVVSVQSVPCQPEVTLNLDIGPSAEVAAVPPAAASAPAANTAAAKAGEAPAPITTRPAGAPTMRKNMWAQEAEC